MTTEMLGKALGADARADADDKKGDAIVRDNYLILQYADDADARDLLNSGVKVNQKVTSAEETTDPLVRLTERIVGSPDTPFVPEELERISTTKRTEKHKNAEQRTSQVDTLIDFINDVELFHTAEGTAFADLDINGHRETWPVRDNMFKHWLSQCFYEKTARAPSSEALQSALNTIEAKAHFKAPERSVFIRVGERDGKLYLDLSDKDGGPLKSI